MQANFSDVVGIVTNPFKFLKSKMEGLDNAQLAYEACSRQYNEENNLVQRFNLPDNFQTWFNITVIHLWLCSAKLRALGAPGNELRQEMFNLLWVDVELRLSKSGVKHNLNKIVTDLLSSYYGQTLAYDEGLVLGDAVLAAALWRNVYLGGDASAQSLQELVEYIHMQMQHLDESDLLRSPQAPFKI
ncbi:ubiquinol-cytochrome C chaperone-domain-containing protein [Zopfochytrium polystomum]|nr:ubiquinol-cytochrome C chaperone-domain-containing protein [Zopfochytrium polystomum]